MSKKVIASIGMLLLLVIIAALGLKMFTIVMSVFAVLSYLDFFNYKYNAKNNEFLKVLGIISLLFIVLNGVFYNLSYISVYVISLIIIIIPVLFYKNKYILSDVMYIFGIVVFLSLSYGVIISIYRLSIVRYIYVIVVALLCDVYSYIGTRLIGKHKIKNTDETYEGFIFGIVMSSFVSSVIHYNLIGENIIIVILISFLLSIFAMMGNIIFYNVKTKRSDLKIRVMEQFDGVILVALMYAIIINII